MGSESYIRKTLHTPKGAISTLSKEYYYKDNLYTMEHMFKSNDDYERLYCMLENTEYYPSYEAYNELDVQAGDSGFVIAHMGYDPMHELMVNTLGIERFIYEYADNRRELLDLYFLLREKHREMYAVVAASPANLVIYGGNIQCSIVSPALFKQYYLPCFKDASEVLHRGGKKIAVHWDGPFGGLRAFVEEMSYDMIDAFCPPPDGDMTLGQAQITWPNMIISMHFPTGLHHTPYGTISEKAYDYFEEAKPWSKFMMSLTEDFPREWFDKILQGIADGLEKCSK